MNKFSKNPIQTLLSVEITGIAMLIFALEAFQITEQIKKNQNAFSLLQPYTLTFRSLIGFFDHNYNTIKYKPKC